MFDQNLKSIFRDKWDRLDKPLELLSIDYLIVRNSKLEQYALKPIDLLF